MLRWLALLGMAAGIGAIAALWTWTLPGDASLYPATSPADAVEIHVLNNGFHTDIAVPRRLLEAEEDALARASRSLGSGDWVRIGWGDARFFVDESPIAGRLLDGVRAFFLPGNASVVMLDPDTDPAQSYDAPQRATLRLSRQGFAGLRARVAASLALTDGQARLSTARPGDGAHFFAAREAFWIGYLCNNWTARVLNAGGIAVRPQRSETAAEVMRAVAEARKLDTTAPQD